MLRSCRKLHPGRPRRCRRAVGLVGLVGLAGCVTVGPAQRGILAMPEMTPASDAQEEAFYGHVEAAREGAAGGHGAAGGGCGCG
ncbi:MAG: DUF4266 domain-containing protein [Deltaproteobacteria bacterium]|nr:MAG: DUF4266 domain-containing protein [Deltaproteobacteria bacterium]